jgi:hypothetical protein
MGKAFFSFMAHGWTLALILSSFIKMRRPKTNATISTLMVNKQPPIVAASCLKQTISRHAVKSKLYLAVCNDRNVKIKHDTATATPNRALYLTKG